MQVGDKVQVLGVVKDIVGDSTLMVCDDSREYWILSKNVSEQPVPTAAETAKTPAPSPTVHETISTHGSSHEATHTAKK